MGSIDRVTFDLALARGLDYYTGVIFEAVLLDPTVGVGSIAAGGRYDHLVGMFSPSGSIVPCVGGSIGVERVFAIMEARALAEAGGMKRTPVSVLVAAIPSARYDMTLQRMRVAGTLWRAGISAEIVYAADPKLQKQVTVAAETGIRITLVLGEDELDRGEVQVKDMASRSHANVPIANIVDAVTRILATPADAAGAGAGAVAGADAVTVEPAVPAAAPVPVAAAAAAGGAGASAPAAGGAGATAGAAASATSSSSGGGGGSVGVVTEGLDRQYGRFSRPAVPIIGGDAGAR